MSRTRLYSDLPALQRAQRLTASKVCPAGGGIKASTLTDRCSTPYGIKGMSRFWDWRTVTEPSQCSTPYGIKGMSSLNSTDSAKFWIECSTPYGIKGMSSRERTLWHASSLRCSTPYGIKGMSSKPLGIPSSECPVLNALRHQRYVQVAFRRRFCCTVRCSTPYGIKGMSS